MRRGWAITAAVAAASLVSAGPAAAHGLVGRSDLPIPEWLFGWAAAAVLVVSFAALALLWRSPRLEDARPRRLFAVPVWLAVLCGALGVLAFAGMVYAGLAGNQTPTSNAAPTVVYVLVWVGLPIVSAVFGDVFRAFSPWRAIGRAGGWAVSRSMEEPPPPLNYPERLGRWPAVVGLLAFGWLELIAANGDDPSVLGVLALAYLATQLVGMSLFGVETWIDRADPFGVYFSMFARLSPFTSVDGAIAVRRPLSGLTDIRWLPGTVTFLCVAIGITAFDGASEGSTWTSVARELQELFAGLGLSLGTSLELAFTIGLAAAVLIVATFFRAGVAGMHLEARNRGSGQLARRFAHSLVPITLAYVVAHYVSLLIFQGQATAYLASDPLGDGSDLLGTATAGIDYSVLSASTIWYVQVGALVAGHVAGLATAHDRALVDFGHTETAVRSQYWMLAVMVGFTTLGLWLLSEANG